MREERNREVSKIVVKGDKHKISLSSRSRVDVIIFSRTLLKAITLFTKKVHTEFWETQMVYLFQRRQKMKNRVGFRNMESLVPLSVLA